MNTVTNGIDTVFDRPRTDPSEQTAQDRAERAVAIAQTASEQGADVFVHALAQVWRTHPKRPFALPGPGTAWQDHRLPGRRSCPPDAPRGLPAHPAVHHARRAWPRPPCGGGRRAAALVSIGGATTYFATPIAGPLRRGRAAPGALRRSVGPVSADVRDFDLGWAAGRRARRSRRGHARAGHLRRRDRLGARTATARASTTGSRTTLARVPRGSARHGGRGRRQGRYGSEEVAWGSMRYVEK